LGLGGRYLFVTDVTDVLDPPDVDPMPEPTVSSKSQFARWGLSTHDVLVLAAGAWLCVASGPFTFKGWTPRMAVILAVLPIGLVSLWRLARRRDRAALAAAGFLGWATISALASRAPWMSLVGYVGRNGSVLIFCGVLGLWALSRGLSDRARELVGPVIVAALGVSAFVGILQIILDIDSGPLAIAGGRAMGLDINPVYFAATLGGAAAWCASRAMEVHGRSRMWLLTGAAYFTFAIGLSGSRSSVGAIVVACAVICIRSRRLESGWTLAAVMSGFALSTLSQRQLGGGRSADTVNRFGESAGFTERFQVWKNGVSAVLDRPLLGWGPDRIRPAIQHHFSADFTRAFQREDISQQYFDVHNFILQILIAVGVIGLALLVAFVVFNSRRSNFTLTLTAATIVLNWMLQPAWLSSLPLVAILLGAAATRPTSPPQPRRHRRDVAGGVALALGLLAAGGLLTADLGLRVAADSGNPATVRRVAGWFGDDPYVLDNFVVNTYDPTIPAQRPARVAAARRAAEAEPDIPFWWSELAMTQRENGDLAGMRSSIDKALALQPNHVRSWTQLALWAQAVGDDALAKEAEAHACSLGAMFCDPATLGADDPTTHP